jgi:hypothetical protein
MHRQREREQPDQLKSKRPKLDGKAPATSDEFYTKPGSLYEFLSKQTLGYVYSAFYDEKGKRLEPSVTMQRIGLPNSEYPYGDYSSLSSSFRHYIPKFFSINIAAIKRKTKQDICWYTMLQ